MDKAIIQAAQRMSGLLMAFAYPDEMNIPTRQDCIRAIDEFDDAMEQAAHQQRQQRGEGER